MTATILLWCFDHPGALLSFFASLLYVAMSIAKRPDPATLDGWRRALWETADRLSILTRDRVGGDVKALFAPSPKKEP